MRQSRAPRVARGAVGASIATFAALFSHVAAGGNMPGWLGITVPWVLALAVCTMLAGRKLSVVRLSLSVVVTQTLFHTLFVLGSPTVGAGSTHSGHQHGQNLAATLAPASSDTVAAIGADPLMWLSHGLAAAVTIVALHRGERALQRLLALAAELRAWLGRVVARWMPVPTSPASGVRLPAASHPLTLKAATHLEVAFGRGPPAIHVL